MNRADVVAGLLLAVGFGACLWDASTFQYGTQFAPGPGFAPVWLSAIGVALSVLIAFNAFKAHRRAEPPNEERPEALDRRGVLRVAVTVVGLIAMVAIAPALGLVSSILLFLLFLTIFVQRLSLVAGIGASVGTVIFVYLIFVRLLDVPIPSGPLGF
jgi:hypothetical protein